MLEGAAACWEAFYASVHSLLLPARLGSSPQDPRLVLFPVPALRDRPDAQQRPRPEPLPKETVEILRSDGIFGPFLGFIDLRVMFQ